MNYVELQGFPIDIHVVRRIIYCSGVCVIVHDDQTSCVCVSLCSSRARWRRVARRDSQGEPHRLLSFFLPSLPSLSPTSLSPLSYLHPYFFLLSSISLFFPSPPSIFFFPFPFPSLSLSSLLPPSLLACSCAYFFPQAHVVCVVYDLTDENALDRVSLCHMTCNFCHVILSLTTNTVVLSDSIRLQGW